MRIDRRGDIGFMEAMAGAMTVCLALMSFMSYVAADAVHGDGDTADFDESLLDGLTIDNRELMFPSDEGFVSFIESSGISGIRLTINSGSTGSDLYYSGMWGKESDSTLSEKHIITVTGEDGSTIPLMAEAILFI